MAELVTLTRGAARGTSEFVPIHPKARFSKRLTPHLTGRPRSCDRVRRPEEWPAIDHLPQPVSTSSSAYGIQLADQIRLQRPQRPRGHFLPCIKPNRLRHLDQRPKRLPRYVQWTSVGFDNTISSTRGLVPLPRNRIHSRKLLFPRRVLHGLPDVQFGHQAAYLQRGPVPGQSGLP